MTDGTTDEVSEQPAWKAVAKVIDQYGQLLAKAEFDSIEESKRFVVANLLLRLQMDLDYFQDVRDEESVELFRRYIDVVVEQPDYWTRYNKAVKIFELFGSACSVELERRKI